MMSMFIVLNFWSFDAGGIIQYNSTQHGWQWNVRY